MIIIEEREAQAFFWNLSGATKRLEIVYPIAIFILVHSVIFLCFLFIFYLEKIFTSEKISASLHFNTLLFNATEI